MTESKVSATAQLAAIDEEIAFLSARIALLKTKRNTIVPIFSLPNEVMSRIITIYAVESNSLASLGWTKVMLVCRLWREISLTSQPLWSVIDVPYRGFYRVARQLELSGAAPLTIKLGATSSLSYARILRRHAARIRSLELSGPVAEMHSIIESLAEDTFPILHSLSLQAHGTQDVPPPMGPMALPPELFTECMSRLRSLTLRQIDLPWMSLTRLQYLDLTDSSDSTPSDVPSFDTLLSMLRLSPELKTLSFHSVIQSAIPERQYPVVELPALEYLSLRENVEDCATLLSHLVVPSNTHMYLLPLGVSTGDDIRDLLIPIRKHIRATDAPIPALLKINCAASLGPIPYFSTAIFENTSVPDNFNSMQSGILSINSHPRNEHSLRQIMSKMLKAFPSQSITHLDAREATHLTLTSWKAALLLLPSLETINLSANEAAVNLTTALLAAKPGASGAGYAHLRSIQLTAFMWSSDQTPIIASAVDMLEQPLTTCHNNGTPVERLTVEERNSCLEMNEDRWNVWFGLVGTLIKDGQVYDPVQRRKLVAQMSKEHAALLKKLRVQGLLDDDDSDRDSNIDEDD
ncbi:hypothetical protein C8J57DRAFT_1528655 [Mycena rebaudengoi]|nr:hypothetical protein C8J57DRAFT_1528655 [Mycena rebaudengoi]